MTTRVVPFVAKNVVLETDVSERYFTSIVAAGLCDVQVVRRYSAMQMVDFDTVAMLMALAFAAGRNQTQQQQQQQQQQPVNPVEAFNNVDFQRVLPTLFAANVSLDDVRRAQSNLDQAVNNTVMRAQRDLQLLHQANNALESDVEIALRNNQIVAYENDRKQLTAMLRSTEMLKAYRNFGECQRRTLCAAIERSVDELPVALSDFLGSLSSRIEALEAADE
jgi:hypothetical protein